MSETSAEGNAAAANANDAKGGAEIGAEIGDVLRQGSLEVRLAVSDEEVAWSQALRYRVFYEEMSAQPSAEMRARGLDFDDYDAVADHLLVIDHSKGDGPESVVGTYRLIRREAAAKVGRFYSADEYDISPLVDYPGPVLELGRSCVDSGHRSKGTMQLLWRGIASYIHHRDIGIMFGCASIPGTEVEALAAPLSYLYHHHLAPEGLRPRAIPERHVDMNLMPRDQVDAKRVLSGLPPLIKGYLRLGGFVGDGAVVDHQFNTTDVCVVVKTELVTDKYFRHYERDRAASGGDPGA